MQPVISVVIPVFNGADVIGQQLTALCRQDFEHPFEVIVADNGSTDETSRVVRAWSDRLHLSVVDASSVRGVSHARNMGVRAARSDRIVICDADDLVDPGWLRAMFHALEAFDAVGGPVRVDRLNDPVSVESRPPIPVDRLPGGADPYLLGANCGFSRVAFDAIGGYDEGLVGGGDDVDFAWRLRDAGYSLRFVREAWVDYRYRSGLRALFRQYRQRGASIVAMHERWPERVDRPSVAQELLWLLKTAPAIARGGARRGSWVRQAARLVGIIEARRSGRNTLPKSA